MAYVYSGDGYRAGAAGVESDLGLRDYYAQRAADSLGQGLDRWTDEDRERARQDLQDPLNRYRNLADNGMYSGADMSAILSGRVQQVNRATDAMQKNFNAQLAQRGQAGNAGANAALGMAGQFEAAGQRGQAYGDLMSEQAQSKLAGLEGLAGVSGALSNLNTVATRQQQDSAAYDDLYEKWRNKQVGYDGAKWGTKPAQPGYYAG